MTLNWNLIRKATLGDPESINRIVLIYQPYINTLTTMTLFDSGGNKYTGVNVDMQERLTAKLIHLIHTYKIA